MQMIEYTMAGEGRRLGLFVHHTDAEREYAYDRKSHVGRLDEALDRADAMGWIIVDMKQDWKTVFPAPRLIWCLTGDTDDQTPVLHGLVRLLLECLEVR